MWFDSELERVEVEKESLLRELEKTPEMEMMRARAQGEVERFKRENSRLSARIGLLLILNFNSFFD